MTRRRLKAPSRRLRVALKVGAAASAAAKNPVPKPAKRYAFSMPSAPPAREKSSEAEQLQDPTDSSEDPDGTGEPEIDKEDDHFFGSSAHDAQQEEPEGPVVKRRQTTDNLQGVVRQMKYDLRAKE